MTHRSPSPRLRPCVGLLLATLLPAQSDPAPVLARAAVLEEHEQDPTAAIAIFRRIAADPQAPAATRTEAELRLGLALRRLGRAAEARAALDRAAAGAGDAAARAKAALQQKVDPKIAAVVTRAIADLRNPVDEVAFRAMADLDFAGDAMLEPLVESIRLESADRTFLKRALDLLTRQALKRSAANAALVDLLHRGDLFVREHAVEALVTSNLKLTAESRPKLVVVLRAAFAMPEARLRKRVAILCTIAQDPELLRNALQDADPEVRQAACNSLAGRREGDQVTAELLAVLEASLQIHPTETGPAIMNAPWLFVSHAGQQLWLKALIVSPPADMQSLMFAGDLSQLGASLGAEKDLHLRLIAESCPMLRTWKADDRRQWALKSLLTFVARSWTDAAIPTVVELLRCVELPGVAYGLKESGWLERRRLPDAAFPVVAEYVRHMLQVKRLDGTVAYEFLRQLALAHHPQKTRVLEELAALESPVSSVCLQLAVEEPLDPELAAAMGRAALRPEIDPEMRGRFLFQLLRGSSPVFAQVVAEAYELGVGTGSGVVYVNGRVDPASPFAQARHRPLGWMKPTNPTGLRPIFDLATWTKLVQQCVKSERRDLWEDLVNVLQGIPVAALEPLAEALPELLRGPIDHNVLLRAAELLVTQGPRTLRAGVLLDLLQADKVWIRPNPDEPRDWAWTPELTKACLAQLAPAKPHAHIPALQWLQSSGDAAAIPALEQFLERGLPQPTQVAAITAILALDPANEEQRLLRWLEAKSATLRTQAIQRMALTLNKAHAPLFLERLRDPSEQVREAAQKALREIEFYLEQTGRWQRLNKAGGLDATTAAEALLAQARQGDKATRLLALGSLGSLAVAETLPLLIEMCKDQDAEIAAAARDAVLQIQAARKAK